MTSELSCLHDICRHEDWFASKEGGHGFIHDAVGFDETNTGFRERGGVDFASKLRDVIMYVLHGE